MKTMDLETYQRLADYCATVEIPLPPLPVGKTHDYRKPEVRVLLPVAWAARRGARQVVVALEGRRELVICFETGEELSGAIAALTAPSVE